MKIEEEKQRQKTRFLHKSEEKRGREKKQKRFYVKINTKKRIGIEISRDFAFFVSLSLKLENSFLSLSLGAVCKL